MGILTLVVLCLALFHIPVQAGADELTRIIQLDLQSRGYDPGNTSGEMSTETIIAVSKFQAEHDLGLTEADLEQCRNPAMS